MTRATAFEILKKHLNNKKLFSHSLATEATMRALAPKFNGDVEEWGITGLLHDADYDKAKGFPDQHGMLLTKLEPNTIPTAVEHAIQSHNYEFTHVIPVSPMDWAITCCDELTAIIVFLAQEQKEKSLTSLTTNLILTKLKDKHFAKGAKRETIYFCKEKLGIPLEDFVAITLTAMQGIHTELGL
ncbi:MAG TPA: HD domain-containing protein [Patescibacteria group bacterium]|nr:HD domain-containing protein [Patescibacteria group bacterium]